VKAASRPPSERALGSIAQRRSRAYFFFVVGLAAVVFFVAGFSLLMW